MIYFDNSSTTKPSAACVAAIDRALTETWGNPSSLHKMGVDAEKELDETRCAAASVLGCDEREIYFTSGGTEANNTAILGAARARKKRGHRIVVSAVEHHSVLECFELLESEGFEVIKIMPESDGSISEDAITDAINSDTVLVSIMLVNNETGAIFPVRAARKALDSFGGVGLLHVDAVQAFGKLDASPKRLGADLMSLSGHKIHGPKGTGILYKSEGVHIPPHEIGGGQERNLRSGTESVPLICGLGAAIKEFDIKGNAEKVGLVNARLRERLPALGGIINSPDAALPYILNVSFPTYRSETLLHFLEAREIYVSSGSACARGAGSHVLSAMGLSRDRVDSALRLSYSAENTVDEADAFCSALGSGLKILRHR